MPENWYPDLIYATAIKRAHVTSVLLGLQKALDDLDENFERTPQGEITYRLIGASQAISDLLLILMQSTPGDFVHPAIAHLLTVDQAVYGANTVDQEDPIE